MQQHDPASAFPIAITSRLATNAVNEAVVLFEGAAIITETDGPTERYVKIVHEWTPRPVLVCRYSTPGEQPFNGDIRVLSEPVRIEIPTLGVTTEARYYDRYSCGSDHRHGLALVRHVEIHPDAEMSRVIFHVINCRDFSEQFITFPSGSSTAGRIELSTKEWLITIDRVDGSQKLTETLQQTGGRAFTHRVQVMRRDEALFKNDQIGGIASLIEHFIAFTTGSWASLSLPIGYSGEAETWQLWRVRQTSSWASVYTWSSNLPPRFVKAVFSGFATRFLDEDWHDPFTQAIDWYVQCRNGTDETSIILGQAALELLAWVVYVELGEIIRGTSGFENLWASDRIRLLLAQMQVSYAFPPRVSELAEFAYEGNQTYKDGPHAVTEVRNGITHPKKAKRERFGEMGPLIRHQASELGLFYLECCLLGLCEYFGPFRADPVCGALYTREPLREPVYPTADFSQLPGMGSVE